MVLRELSEQNRVGSWHGAWNTAVSVTVLMTVLTVRGESNIYYFKDISQSPGKQSTNNLGCLELMRTSIFRTTIF